MIKHYNITIKGKVQGVWYRKSTQEKAAALGIKGYVKNLPNGNVFIEAQGNESQLDALLEWCSKGPEYAVVDTISFEEGNLKSFDHFEIVR